MSGAWRRLERRAARLTAAPLQGLRGEEGLRAELLRLMLAACAGTCALYLVLGWMGIVRSFLFPWDAVELGGAIVLSTWLLRRGNISTATLILVVFLSHPSAFVMATYGPGGPAPALLIVTIVMCGLLVGRKRVWGWSVVCCAILLFDAGVRGDFSAPVWRLVAAWSGAYLTVGWLVALFSTHLEKLLAAEREIEEAERAAVAAERTRMAREIHDTLAQGFTGVIVQMNAAEEALASRPERVAGHLERARTLARDGLREARAAVLELREPGGDLLRDIRHSAARITESSGIAIAVTSEGPRRRLGERVESHLLRIAQEAVTNAVRHATPRRIDIQLYYDDSALRLEIRDDGRGLANSGGSGLGIRGMTERAREIGGELRMVTGPGSGTTVRVVAPIAQ